MQQDELSLEVDFIRQLPDTVAAPFGSLEKLVNLGIKPDWAGVRMQLMGSLKRTATLSATESITELEALVDDPNFLQGWFSRTLVKRQDSVCLIKAAGTDYKGRQGRWKGTGFLISPNLLMTNHHVLNSVAVGQQAECIFNYELEESSQPTLTKSFSLNPDRLFITSPVKELDFTVCWVDGNPGDEYGFIPVYRHAFTIKNQDFANIIQHPQGDPKAVVLQHNEVEDQDEVAVFYTSDTLPGSSGAVVLNNALQPFALHHASRLQPGLDGTAPNAGDRYQNEGIKFAAIAAYLESLPATNPSYEAARQVLALIRGTDAVMGYFGGLGRIKPQDSPSGEERVVDVYKGEAQDIDVGFWNIEWFNKHYQTKLAAVGQLVMEMNLDVWVFEESSSEAAQALAVHLNTTFKAQYEAAASEPDADGAKQTTTVLWNTATVDCTREEWPDKIRGWLALDSRSFSAEHELPLETRRELESVDGKIFDRYPGLFKVTAKNRATGANPTEDYQFHLVPLHLKAMAEGSKRRRLASQILAAAVTTMMEEYEAGDDWILGGDFNATLASGDFSYLSKGKLQALSATDEQSGAFTYLKKPYQTLIDHVFVSPGVVPQVGTDGFFVVARDKSLDKFLEISDHRPILVRISLRDQSPTVKAAAPTAETEELRAILGQLNQRRQPTSRPGLVSPEATVPASLEQALGMLESRTDKVYYDATTDSVAAQAYYRDLQPDASPVELYNQLSKLLRQTHKNELPYKPAIHLYPWVDLQPGGEELISIYSGKRASPEAFIRADFATDRHREEERVVLEQARKLESSSLSSPEREELLETLESQYPYNCEHVVPQSWFDKANPMRGDLHHLFACEPDYNSFRSNIPYYDFHEWEEAVREDCGRREPKQFEPQSGKGAVARATLYFLLRYPGVIGKGPDQYSVERLQTLLAWHNREMPTEYERHRNAAIEEAQGNRNPLIDFPKLAARIDFTRGLG